LFLNAGVVFESSFNGQTPEQIQATVGCNALQPIYTTKVLLDQILARGKLAAIVVTSSGLGEIPVPMVTTYCATKSFVSFLAVGLSYELEGKVDFMTWACGGVTTKMTKN